MSGALNCAKSILNYFAAFNETRFTFSKKLLYRWSDDALTLDLSVFPEFEEELLSAVAGNQPLRLTIRQGQHTVEADGHRLKALMMEALQSKLNQDFLVRATEAARAAIEPSGNGEQGPEVEARVVQEGLREFNLACRRELQASLVQVQKERIEQLRQQFEIGKYIRAQYHRNIPKYRVDFLLTLSQTGKERSLLIEYDGVGFHTSKRSTDF